MEIAWTQLIEFRDVYGASADEDRYGLSGVAQRQRYDALGLQPT
ncbi:hypothetical protein [Acidipropionibacterium timonense]|nr:hypothetical protein [Acidipropionibacterium timonense]